MPDTEAFESTFATLRGILAASGRDWMVGVDTPADFQLCSRTLKDRSGKPFFVAAVQIKKNYVSYHFVPIYMAPELGEAMSPALRKRMQGKGCFNFTTIEPAQVKELTALTKKGLIHLKKMKLPWAS
jgi:hypothetical protein